MWRCKDCGEEIVKIVYGDFEGESGELDKNGKSSFDVELTNYDIREEQYFCNWCGNAAANINDMANWVEEE